MILQRGCGVSLIAFILLRIFGLSAQQNRGRCLSEEIKFDNINEGCLNIVDRMLSFITLT